ncbi:UNVERIFIED_CONTAM: hypothetical protein Sindi_0494900 [Sesamum indicum]
MDSAQRMVFDATRQAVWYKSIRERNPNHKKTSYAILRYLSITSRQEKLYALEATTEQMTWHANNQTEEGSMCHSSDADACRHFHWTHPHFAVEPRKVRVHLCTNGLAPHGQYGGKYSCWPFILTSYNLPLGICMSAEYMFVMMVIPGTSNSIRLINVYLEPLIEES